MLRTFISFISLGLLVLFSTGLAFGDEKIKGKIDVPKAAVENKMINGQLDRIDESIDKIVESIWNVPITKREYEVNKDMGAGTILIPKKEMELEIIKQRLDAINQSISNIGQALTKRDLPPIGTNCKSVCSAVTCTDFGLPANADHATSGGTPVCLNYECIAWVWKCS